MNAKSVALDSSSKLIDPAKLFCTLISLVPLKERTTGKYASDSVLDARLSSIMGITQMGVITSCTMTISCHCPTSSQQEKRASKHPFCDDLILRFSLVSFPSSNVVIFITSSMVMIKQRKIQSQYQHKQGLHCIIINRNM